MFLRDVPERTGIYNEDFCSVGIVSFNRHDKLHRLIDSIHKHADMPFELVISDDGGKLYNDYNFINSLKDKISHISLNLGRNKGLHVNANNAVSMTRSKYVSLFYDDIEVKSPFMRNSVEVLKRAPYVGVIYLGNSYQPSHTIGTGNSRGIIGCQTSAGYRYAIMCKHGGSWATSFRKDYWHEVGGYSEDDIYGDLPFINKGWSRGYFSAVLEGDFKAWDTDKGEFGQSVGGSSGSSVDGGYANYPKIFGIPDQTLRSMDLDRANQCSLRNHNGRSEKPNEYEQHGWNEYIIDVIGDGKINWDLLNSGCHSKFTNQIKADAQQCLFGELG